MVTGLWPMAYGQCSMPFGLWLMVWPMAYGLCSMAYGPWPMAFDLWTLVYDVSLALSPVLVGLRLSIEVGPYPELWLTL